MSHGILSSLLRLITLGTGKCVVETLDMPTQIRRVAVIGAGPAGAIATDALVKEGAFDTIRVFDRRAGVGGTW